MIKLERLIEARKCLFIAAQPCVCNPLFSPRKSVLWVDLEFFVAAFKYPLTGDFIR
jgi:hypothetical protein